MSQALEVGAAYADIIPVKVFLSMNKRNPDEPGPSAPHVGDSPSCALRESAAICSDLQSILTILS